MIEPAQKAYEAYRHHRNCCMALVGGQTLPQWKDVNEEIKQSWRAAVAAILN